MGFKTLANIPENIYVKALPLSDLSDVQSIKDEVHSGNIVIVRITPLAKKSIEDMTVAISELCDYVKSINGDIARL